MSSPAVASSATSGSELRRSHPSPPLPLSHHRWDDRLLTQALTDTSSSRESLARALSQCLAGRSAWKTSYAPTYAAVIGASQQPSRACLQQKQQQDEKSDAASPMSNSDLKESSGSALNSPPCASSNGITGFLSGESTPHDAKAFLPRQENEDALGIHVETALLAAAMNYTAHPVKINGEGHGQVGLLPSSARATTPALSATAALGSAGTKVNKRRSRATSKVPITVLSADASNFRAMVQKLTGIPMSASMQPNRFPFWSSQDASVLKPHPTRPSQSIQGLPTLDTSAYLLADGGSSGIHGHNSKLITGDNVLQTFPNAPFLKPSLQQSDLPFRATAVTEFGVPKSGVHVNPSGMSLGASPDLKPSHRNLYSGNFAASLPSLWDAAAERTQGCFSDKFNGKDAYNGLIARGDLFNLTESSSFDNLITGNDRSDYDLSSHSLHAVDSWLSPDTALPKKTELTRSA